MFSVCAGREAMDAVPDKGELFWRCLFSPRCSRDGVGSGLALQPRLSWLALVSSEVWIWGRGLSQQLCSSLASSPEMSVSPILEQHHLSNWNDLSAHCLDCVFSCGIVRKTCF